MVTSCCAYGCKERAKKGGVSFHVFPKNPDERMKWVNAIRRENFQPTDHTSICGKHFHESDYINHFGQRKLKQGVVPSIFNFPKHIKVKGLKKNGEHLDRKRKIFSVIPPKICDNEPVTKIEESPQESNILTLNDRDCSPSFTQITNDKQICEQFSKKETSPQESNITELNDPSTTQTIDDNEEQVCKQVRIKEKSSQECNILTLNASMTTQTTGPDRPESCCSKDETPLGCLSWKRPLPNRREPIYFGDFHFDNLTTDEGRKIWSVANKQILKHRKTIKILRIQQKRLQNKVATLCELVRQLKDENKLTNNCEEMLQLLIINTM